MMQESAWSVVFFATPDGDEPIREFLRSQDQQTRARFGWSIEQLRLRNVHARPPLVKHLEGELWELREESATNIYRLIYCFLPGRRILFLHGFQKKAQQTPRREIVLAEQRRRAFLIEAARGGGDNHHD